MKDIQKTKPNYYAIIPAEIRYHKKLKPNEKLLYGEITALCDKSGICWASNSYFARLYEVDVRSVSRWILNLKKLGFIDYEISKKEGNRRYISLLTFKSIAIDKKVHSYGQKSPYPIDLKIYSPNKDEQLQINNINEHYKLTNPNPLKKSSEILELDLKIAQEKKFLIFQLESIFHPNERERKTFSRVISHLVNKCQKGELHISIFKDAIEWARFAKASNAVNKKGLFISKIKEETGFRKQERLLKSGVI